MAAKGIGGHIAKILFQDLAGFESAETVLRSFYEIKDEKLIKDMVQYVWDNPGTWNFSARTKELAEMYYKSHHMPGLPRRGIKTAPDNDHQFLTKLF